MDPVTLTEGMVRQILLAETSALRFEAFCIELYSALDSRTYVGTSLTYDQGRDARAASAADAASRPAICVSLRKDALDKSREDAKSLFAHAAPRLVRFCSSQMLTEHAIDQIEAVFRDASAAVETVLVDGQVQLAQLACQYPHIVECHYPGEVANLRSALAVTEVGVESVQLTGMRIALTTQLGSDATSFREDLQRNLVLTALSDDGGCTVATLANRISQLLHLPRSVQPDYLNSTLADLERTGHIERADGGRFCITETGRAEIRDRTEKGSVRLGEGQQAVLRALHDLCGESLDSTQAARLWNVFQDAIANMFHANGIYITESVTSILDGHTTVADHPNLQQHIEELSQKIAALNIWGARAPDIKQAICDLFQDHTSDAFRWLSDLCLVYVSLCSLGLDRNAQDQVVGRLRELDLILDTDIVLSFLSPGEPLHETIKAVVGGWRRISGSVHVAPPVLEETAYHAYIANRDYEEVWRRLGDMDERDALRLINNAFVRGFRVESPGQYQRSRWGHYIGQFKGTGEYDYQKVVALLKEDGILVIGEDAADPALASEVADRLLRPARQPEEGEGGPTREYRDKCLRDGRLVAILEKHRRARAEVGGSGVVISSSRHLRDACRPFVSRLGPPEPVLPVGAIAYLLSLVPGINLSLGSLRAVLFDVDYRTKLPPIDRLIMRIIHASEEYMLPFARRASLKPIMRDKIRLLAQQRGQRVSEIVRQAESGDPAIVADFAGAVAAAVDTIARSEAERRAERSSG